MTKVYIVEDDDNIRELVLYALKNECEAVGFESSEAFWAALREGLPDLVLLDIMLPGEDGIAILKALKTAGSTKHLPVIMLTAKTGELDRVKGLDAGADDYVTKPFSVLELMSRIRAVLRRTGAAEDGRTALRAGNVALFPERHAVEVDGEAVTLTYKEFELLRLLLENQGRVLTRDRIMSAVWGTGFEGETRTVDMHIKTLRKKLGTGGTIIGTVRGVGYKAEDRP